MVGALVLASAPACAPAHLPLYRSFCPPAYLPLNSVLAVHTCLQLKSSKSPLVNLGSHTDRLRKLTRGLHLQAGRVDAFIPCFLLDIFTLGGKLCHKQQW